MYDLNQEIESASKAIVSSIAKDSTAVRDLRTFNEQQTIRDPARVAWPATLTIELALKTATPQELKEHYEFSDEEWEALRHNQLFINELSAMCETIKQEGMSFKHKAKLQAEALLETQWRLIHGPASEVPAAVKQRGIETIFRVAGYDSKDGVPGGGNNLQIAIQFSGAP